MAPYSTVCSTIFDFVGRTDDFGTYSLRGQMYVKYAFSFLRGGGEHLTFGYYFRILKFGNNTFDARRFDRRCKRQSKYGGSHVQPLSYWKQSLSHPFIVDTLENRQSSAGKMRCGLRCTRKGYASSVRRQSRQRLSSRPWRASARLRPPPCHAAFFLVSFLPILNCVDYTLSQPH